MTRELIIEGQQVDLAPDTDITLEYNGNVLGEIGKITLSHSYTIKIPRTARNARILDDPGNLGHASGATRRLLNARFFRNGIDLIGPAQVYVLKTSPEVYEIALVWNTLETLQTLSQSSASLNDLPNLPVLTWIKANGTAPDYSGGDDKDGALFAFYNSGLGGKSYPAINTATHPCITVTNLLDRITNAAGVPVSISQAAQQDANNIAILAAPEHKPDFNMELESGSIPQSIWLETEEDYYGELTSGILYKDFTNGWDATSAASNPSLINTLFKTGNTSTHKVLINLQAPSSVDLSNHAIRVIGYVQDEYMNADQEELYRAYFRQNSSGWYLYVYADINTSGWDYYSIKLVPNTPITNEIATIHLTPYISGLPLLATHRVHKGIDISKDNRFPIQGNLPNIKQWDFIKACMAMFGWAAVIQNGALHLLTYSDLLNISNAYVWTEKVDMTDGGLRDIEYKLNGWAQQNWLKYKEDTPLGFDPNASIDADDLTLPMSRDLFEIPFAASMQSDAPHYKVDGTKVDDVKIEPRIFEIVDRSGVRTLEFTERLYGKGLISAHYTRLQEIVRKPITISINIRLHEIDLAQLDLTRPVYLGQFGHYYMIQKIQTSKTDLCKVELLQLP